MFPLPFFLKRKCSILNAKNSSVSENAVGCIMHMHIVYTNLKTILLCPYVKDSMRIQGTFSAVISGHL